MAVRAGFSATKIIFGKSDSMKTGDQRKKLHSYTGCPFNLNLTLRSNRFNQTNIYCLFIIMAILLTHTSCAQSASNSVSSNNLERKTAGTIADAMGLIEKHKENEGIEIVNYLIEKSSDSISYLYYLKAMAFYKLQDYQQSLNATNKSISADNSNYISFSLKGDIFQKTSQFDSSLIYYQKAEKGLPNDQYLLNNIGTLYVKTERLDSAKNVYQRLLTIAPNNSDYLYNHSFVYYKLQDYDNALTIIEKAISIKNDDAGYYNLKGQILGKKGYIEEAIKSFEKSIKLKPYQNNATENLRRLRLNHN